MSSSLRLCPCALPYFPTFSASSQSKSVSQDHSGQKPSETIMSRAKERLRLMSGHLDRSPAYIVSFQPLLKLCPPGRSLSRWPLIGALLTSNYNPKPKTLTLTLTGKLLLTFCYQCFYIDADPVDILLFYLLKANLYRALVDGCL